MRGKFTADYAASESDTQAVWISCCELAAMCSSICQLGWQGVPQQRACASRSLFQRPDTRRLLTCR